MTLKSSTNRQLSRLRKARWPLASPVGRIRVLLIAIAVVFSLCAGRALQVQAFDSSAYAAEAADQMKQTQVLPATQELVLPEASHTAPMPTVGTPSTR